ncbi:MAG: N-acetylmuramoyl-L-alanine amidase [Desulfobulbus sp.]
MYIEIPSTVRRMCSALSFLLLLCLWFALIPGSLMARPAAQSSPAIKEQPHTKDPEQRYNATKTRLAKLLISEPASHNRSDWLLVANSFHELFLQNKKTQLGPSCLFMQARTYQLMHTRFHLVGDAETARKAYLDVADLYPGHTLGDDALYKAALLTNVVREKTPSSATLYQQITRQYPQGDYWGKAQQQLNPIQDSPAKEAPPSTPPPKKEKPPQQQAPQTEGVPLAQIAQSKFWSSHQYSRVVISANAHIPYAVKQENNQIVVDLQQSSLPPKFIGTQQFGQGLLQKVTTTQAGKEVVRIQLGVHSLHDYKVFTLKDPFRVIVDMYGEPSSRLVAQPVPHAPNDPEAMKKQEPDEIPVLSDHKKSSLSDLGPHIKMHREHLSLAQQLGLGVKTIVIDPGHGGKDPGAMAFGLKEKDIALNVAKKLAKILSDSFHYRVVLTRTKDVYIPLEKRTAIANAQKADLFVSIHVNAHPNQSNSGIETYFLNLATDADAMRVAALENASSTHSIGELQDILSSLMNNSKIDESSRLARFVQTNLINGFANSYTPRDLGVKQAPFYVLIGAEMPAILAELSFITNPQEARLLKNDHHLEKIAQQLAGGIVAYVDHHRAAVRFY